MAGILGSLLSVLGRRTNYNEPQHHRDNGRKVQRPDQGIYSSKEKNVRRIRRMSSTDERIQKEVAKEDFLLNQIDEFREKAQQLQDLLATKEHKAAELQGLVSARETKANDLQVILDERQKKADAITVEVEKQIDALINKVSAKMDEIEGSMSSNIEEGKRVNEEQAKRVYDALSQIQTQLQGMKDEVNEKIHSENVKCYRNIQDLFKGIDDKLDGINMINDKVKGVKGTVVFTMVLSIINLLGLIAFALYSMGVFQMFLK